MVLALDAFIALDALDAFAITVMLSVSKALPGFSPYEFSAVVIVIVIVAVALPCGGKYKNYVN